jgi:hypothetical protein
MKYLSLSSLLVVSSTHALFREESGKLDFLIATTGHGPPTFVHAIAGGASVITSASCHVASRSIADGSLQWRRNVCSSMQANTHVVTVGATSVVTLDDSGSVRAWSLDSGALLWDVLISAATGGQEMSIRAVSKAGKDYIVASIGSNPSAFDSETGKFVSTPSARELQGQKTASSLEAYCAESSMLIDFQIDSGTLVAWRSNGEGKRTTRLLESEKLVSSLDHVSAVSLLECSEAHVSVLLTTARGTTAQATFNGDAQVHTVWQCEEGLAQVSSALVLDASHHVGDLMEIEEEQLLQYSHRLKSQWRSFLSFFSVKAATDRRDNIFGFVKVAVLLSSSCSRIFGIGTSGIERGKIRYQVDLPKDSIWHRIVHGTANSQSGAHGLNGMSHNREILVLSSTGREIHWMCLDGPNGNVHSMGSIILNSPVVQVVPLVGSGACRQGALLLFKDGSLQAAPSDFVFEKQIKSTQNGLYSHVVDKENSKVTAMRISVGDAGLKSSTMGTAVFAGEEILSAAYPSREEVVQSPCHVLGDDSLLLKYFNPHIAVFITMTTSSSKENEFSKALKAAKKVSGKRKPAGVSVDAADDAASEAEPNLFINLVDTASGLILHRVSHAHVTMSPPPTAIISENWIFYTFMNGKTRRAEVGVLSLVSLARPIYSVRICSIVVLVSLTASFRVTVRRGAY